MPLYLKNLDAEVRKHMLAEFEQDLAEGRLYLSSRLSPRGKQTYPNLLRKAIETGDEITLGDDIAASRCLKDREPTSKGGFKNVPYNASETLAEGEFNRYYIRGLCLIAIEKGIEDVEAYRAKVVNNPREDSQWKIGKHFSARKLLEDLRSSLGVETALGLPSGPNSGLSVRLPLVGR